jgi:hypothetical protein
MDSFWIWAVTNTDSNESVYITNNRNGSMPVRSSGTGWTNKGNEDGVGFRSLSMDDFRRVLGGTIEKGQCIRITVAKDGVDLDPNGVTPEAPSQKDIDEANKILAQLAKKTDDLPL